MFELNEKKTLVCWAHKWEEEEGGGVIWGEYWRWNCWMEMVEKQNEIEILREAQWKP